VFPAETTASTSPAPTAPTATHSDRLGAGDELEAVCIEAGRSEEHRHERLGCGRDGTGHDLVRRVVAAEGVDRDTNRHVSSRYGAGARSGEISRPRYVLHVGQTWCARLGDPHCSQVETRGAEMACCARRLSRRDLEVFRFGTAMSGRQCSEQALATTENGSDNAAVAAARVLTVVVGMAVGSLFAVGFLVAALFERDGFGDRDGDPSTAYLLALAVGMAASLGLPLVLWRALLPARFSWPVAIGVSGVALAAVCWILGIGVTA